jgi:hypothetical protein
MWHELVALAGDVVAVPLLGLILLAVTTVVALLWYHWPPDWLVRPGGTGRGRRRGWRWRSIRWRWRWRLPRWRRRARRVPSDAAPGLPADELPDLPAAELALTADQLAAAGRYKEAVRERLRAIVRELVERDVIVPRPGWTVTELARAAGDSRPPVAAPLAGASDRFSRVWYAQLPAGAADDVAMRGYAGQVRAALTERTTA